MSQDVFERFVEIKCYTVKHFVTHVGNTVVQRLAFVPHSSRFDSRTGQSISVWSLHVLPCLRGFPLGAGALRKDAKHRLLKQSRSVEYFAILIGNGEFLDGSDYTKTLRQIVV